MWISPLRHLWTIVWGICELLFEAFVNYCLRYLWITVWGICELLFEAFVNYCQHCFLFSSYVCDINSSCLCLFLNPTDQKTGFVNSVQVDPDETYDPSARYESSHQDLRCLPQISVLSSSFAILFSIFVYASSRFEIIDSSKFSRKSPRQTDWGKRVKLLQDIRVIVTYLLN